jgi:HlyD family secretion protein
MRRRILIVALLVTAGGGGIAVWWYTHRDTTTTELLLYGNVDLRQVQLAFNNSERIASVLVEEGDRVKEGKLLAELDVGRIKPQVAQAEAQVATQREVHNRLRSGSRPEEIAQARANLASAQADLANARRQYERLKNLSIVKLKDQTEVRAVSQEDVDNAKLALDVAEAKLTVNQKALELSVAGPRKEEVAEAEARLHANEAQLAYLQRQLDDAKLFAPADAVVRSRLMEKGELASPQKAVFALAIINPKWVRAYVSESELGKVRPGMKGQIAVDSFPGRRFEGWVGFISPVAEFTPKAVQTEELRTSLVYEVRIFVKDPNDELRLGMPATVHLPLNQPEKPAAEEAR